MIPKLVILTGLITILFITGCTLQESNSNSNDTSAPLRDIVQIDLELVEDLKNNCIENNGIWIDEFYECEFISQDICLNLGGEFNQCGSACRNDPNAEICTMQCIPYCNFKSLLFQTNTNNNIEEVILDSYSNEVPNNCSLWFDGCNMCSVGESGILACTLMFCEELQEAECREFE